MSHPVPSPARSSNALKAIIWGGVLCGTGDLLFAFVILRSAWRDTARNHAVDRGWSCSGKLQKRAELGPPRSASCSTTSFHSERLPSIMARVDGLPVLIKHAIPSGLIFGAAVYFFMNMVVLPLSAHHARAFPPPLALLPILAHLFLVGLPIALAVRHYSDESHPYSGFNYSGFMSGRNRSLTNQGRARPPGGPFDDAFNSSSLVPCPLWGSALARASALTCLARTEREDRERCVDLAAIGRCAPAQGYRFRRWISARSLRRQISPCLKLPHQWVLPFASARSGLHRPSERRRPPVPAPPTRKRPGGDPHGLSVRKKRSLVSCFYGSPGRQPRLRPRAQSRAIDTGYFEFARRCASRLRRFSLLVSSHTARKRSCAALKRSCRFSRASAEFPETESTTRP